MLSTEATSLLEFEFDGEGARKNRGIYGCDLSNFENSRVRGTIVAIHFSPLKSIPIFTFTSFSNLDGANHSL
jgi:hypothetical protein